MKETFINRFCQIIWNSCIVIKNFCSNSLIKC
jgi:hypothetical protein